MNNPVVEAIKAIIYGIVEGITEWLPVSSTGHMIILSAVPGFNFQNEYGETFWSFFLVVIQLGAILAVIWKFFKKLNPLSVNHTPEQNKNIWKMWLKILIGCLPAGIAGILLETLLPKDLEAGLNSVAVVASMLLLYGVAFVIIERFNKRKYKAYTLSLQAAGKPANTPYPSKYMDVGQITYMTALYIGLIQILSIVPGTSRSGVTILSALLLGASRTAAAEYSFYLSIPIMIGASLVRGYSFVTSGTYLTNNMIVCLFFGILVAFLVSFVVINTLMKWIKKHTFEGFGYYRIAIGAVLLVLFGVGIV